MPTVIINQAILYAILVCLINSSVTYNLAMMKINVDQMQNPNM